MEIGVTKAVQGKIKIKPVEIIKDTPFVFCWDTHLVKLKGSGTGLVLKICEMKNSVWKRRILSIQSSIDNCTEITKNK